MINKIEVIKKRLCIECDIEPDEYCKIIKILREELKEVLK
jgi:hypothetical protein